MMAPKRSSTKKRPATKEADAVKIPKDILNRTLEVIDDPNHPAWSDRNHSCIKSIHRRNDDEVKGSCFSSQNSKLYLARSCLLKRDFRNLGKALATYNSTASRSNNLLYPLCVKYGMICLAYVNQQQLNMYVRAMASTEYNDEIISKYTKYS